MNSKDAAQIDVDLMSAEGGFSIDQVRILIFERARNYTFGAPPELAEISMSDSRPPTLCQLMELAGLSCAGALSEAFPLPHHPRVLVVCGPGNNGGDGLVAARHLHHFGYRVSVLYPKQPPGRSLFQGLVTQCESLGIPVASSLAGVGPLDSFDVAMDAVFGFSFKGEVRAPFDTVLAALKGSALPLLSVDVPSGWDVDRGDVAGTGLRPHALISLTAPKLCASSFSGRHFLGGRFVPPALVSKYGLQLPAFPGASQVVELRGWGAQAPASISAASTSAASTGVASSPESLPLYEDSAKAGEDEELAVVWVTAPAAEAKALANALVMAKVAACVNVIPSVASVYEWEGQVEESEEAMMMVKTRSALLPALTALIQQMHSYDVPETIAAAVVGGNRHYLQWVRDNTRPGPPGLAK